MRRTCNHCSVIRIRQLLARMQGEMQVITGRITELVKILEQEAEEEGKEK